MLTEEEKQYAYFQQDNATPHTAHQSMHALEQVFDDRIISQGLWLPRSPDLSSCDSYLWGDLKHKVYRNNPRTLEALEIEIRQVIGEIPEAELQRVFQNFIRRCSVCIEREGHHFQQLL